MQYDVTQVTKATAASRDFEVKPATKSRDARINPFRLRNIFDNAHLDRSTEHLDFRSSSQVDPRYEYHQNVNLYSEHEFIPKSAFRSKPSFLTILLHLVHEGYLCIAQGY